MHLASTSKVHRYYMKLHVVLNWRGERLPHIFLSCSNVHYMCALSSCQRYPFAIADSSNCSTMVILQQLDLCLASAW